MPLHVFVDTNVWLSFLTLSSDDVKQLEKLLDLIEQNKLKLHIPQQVVDEFNRNRDNKLGEVLAAFKGGISTSVPRFILDLEGAKEYQDILKQADAAKKALHLKIKECASNRSFAVDELIAKIFVSKNVTPVSAEVIEKARLRKEIGNPPGKGSLLGDEINWEFLLASVPDGQNLHVVSKDGDFASGLDRSEVKHFLLDEWKAKKGAGLQLHDTLSKVLNDELHADIEIAEPIVDEFDDLIEPITDTVRKEYFPNASSLSAGDTFRGAPSMESVVNYYRKRFPHLSELERLRQITEILTEKLPQHSALAAYEDLVEQMQKDRTN